MQDIGIIESSFSRSLILTNEAPHKRKAKFDPQKAKTWSKHACIAGAIGQTKSASVWAACSLFGVYTRTSRSECPAQHPLDAGGEAGMFQACAR
ncbi:MAG: hypothetical protein ABSE48_21290, partial [Verrucomicrobiota bacterium]